MTIPASVSRRLPAATTILLGCTLLLVSGVQAREVPTAAEAAAQAEADRVIAVAQDERLALRESATEAARAAERERLDEDRRATLAVVDAAAETRVTTGEVADPATAVQLDEAIAAARGAVPAATAGQLADVRADIAAKVDAYAASHEAWVAEQERLAAEQSARDAQAAAARQTPATGPVAPAQPAPAPAASFTDRVQAIAAQYGCGSAGIIIDDPRIGAGNGMADWFNNTILVRTTTPPGRLTYVVAHECAHLRQYRAYGGDVDQLAAAMNAIYGGAGLSGIEQNADCMTQRWGFSQWYYTASCGGARGAAAAAVASGSRA